MANRKFNFTKEQWEEVAYEVDMRSIGRNPDWAMLNKYAAKLGMTARTFRKYMMIWDICGKRTEDMMIIGANDDEQRDIEETGRIQSLPDLKRS